MACGAQVREPTRKQLVKSFLGEQIFDVTEDFGQRNFPPTVFLQLREQLVVIVSLYGMLVDLDGGPQTGFHEFHQLNFLTQSFL